MNNLEIIAIGFAALCVFGLVVAVAVRPLLAVSRVIDTVNKFLGRPVARALLLQRAFTLLS